MMSVDPAPPRRTRGILFSMAGHAACLALVVLALHMHRAQPIVVQQRCCSVALVWTGPAQSSLTKPAPVARVHRHAHLPVPQPSPHSSPSPVPAPQAAPSQPAVAAQQTPSTTGAGTGDEDAEPAFPVFFPQPGLADRSLLPATEQKIIVNVDISPEGNVTGETLVRGLGNGLDQAVLSVVKSWRFHPATLNGAPVASVQELVFPFSRNMPSGDASGTPG